MKYLKYLEIRPGGWLLLSLIYFFGDWQWLLVILGNSLVHELGHLYLLERLGARVQTISLGLTGACIVYNEYMFSPKAKAAIAAAGPLFGIGGAVFASGLGRWMDCEFFFLFAGVGLVLSGFNLLPARPLDGWWITRCLFPRQAERIGLCTAAAVLAVGLVAMVRGYGTALAFLGLVLLLQDAPDLRRKARFS